VSDEGQEPADGAGPPSGDGAGRSGTGNGETSAPGGAAGSWPAPTVPAYGEASLADLSPSLLMALGVDGRAGPARAGRHGDGPAGVPAEWRNVLDIAPLARVCLFLVDGLGAEQLRAHADAAPFLTSRLGRVLTAGFPSSTATSLCTLGTGSPPGEHGMLGIQLAVPGTGGLLNCLRWTTTPPGVDVDPEWWQPAPTVYERAAAAGVEVGYVAPAMFEGTGLTRAVYRGVRYIGVDSVDERVSAAAAALAAPRAHVTVYYGDLDVMGHLTGWGSPEWRAQLTIVDDLARRLAEVLPPGSALYVTADHGMVNVSERIDVDAEPALRAGVALLGGEARARHVYAAPGAAAAVLDAWRDTLAGRAWVVSREEAVDAGWFGPRVRSEWLARVGDVVAVARSGYAVVASAAEPLESTFTGHHGSLTTAEQHVPLLEVSTR
jgi:hypothetical protein